MEIKPELQNNILKFNYGTNYRYEGVLAHSFDRFYVITKFIIPMLDDLKLNPIKYDKECQYLRNLDDKDDDRIKQNIKDLLFYCAKLRPYMALYKMQITAHNLTAQKILKNEVDLILPKFQTQRSDKRAIFGAIISGFLGLAFEGIFSFLHHKRHRALQKAVKMMSIMTDAQRNKLMHLDNLLIMYRVYNAEILSKLDKPPTCLAQLANTYRAIICRQTGSSIPNLFQNAGHSWSLTLHNKFIIISPNHKRKVYHSL